MKSNILRATLICGAFDIAYATIMAMLGGSSALGTFLSIACGPFNGVIKSCGWAGGMIGLAAHFTIMLIMVACFVLLTTSILIL